MMSSNPALGGDKIGPHLAALLKGILKTWFCPWAWGSQCDMAPIKKLIC